MPKFFLVPTLRVGMPSSTLYVVSGGCGKPFLCMAPDAEHPRDLCWLSDWPSSRRHKRRVSRKVQEEVQKDNRFGIAGGQPGMKVSWQVTGIRQDPYAEQHRIPIEEDKSADEKGKYLHPIEWGQPESKGVGYAAGQTSE